MGERRQRSGRRSRDNARIASERMAILFEEAERAARKGEGALSDRYVSLARSIGMRYNVRLPAGLRRRACRKCGAFLVPGKNLRVRLRGGKTVWTCLKCGEVSRTPNAPRTTNAGQSGSKEGRRQSGEARGKKKGEPGSRETGEPAGKPGNR
jgi:ribonuclease P protein subunit RPR2